MNSSLLNLLRSVEEELAEQLLAIQIELASIRNLQATLSKPSLRRTQYMASLIQQAGSVKREKKVWEPKKGTKAHQIVRLTEAYLLKIRKPAKTAEITLYLLKHGVVHTKPYVASVLNKGGWRLHNTPGEGYSIKREYIEQIRKEISNE